MVSSWCGRDAVDEQRVGEQQQNGELPCLEPMPCVCVYAACCVGDVWWSLCVGWRGGKAFDVGVFESRQEG